MEARSRATWRIIFVGIVTFTSCVLASITTSDAADFRTRNFLVSARSARLARQVGNAAEKYRSELAKYWLGKELRPWPHPCPIVVNAGNNLAAQGVTTYKPAPVRDFQMEVTGSSLRILDSVLPHEVTHTVLATYFGRPLPRWADEGICTTVEHRAEKLKHEAKLREFLRTRRGIPMNQLFLLTEYPDDILPLYAQGYSVCQFLIAQQGPRQFIKFLEDFVQRPSWTANIQKHYGYRSLRELQEYWLRWVDEGSGNVEKYVVSQPRNPVALASAQQPNTAAKATSPNRNAVAVAEPGTALASAADAGWYTRQRQMHAQRERESGVPRTNMASVNAPIAPPSVLNSGTYSSAHPQPEHGGPSQTRISGTGQGVWR